jgi:sarcosine oxidase subunit beta
MTSIVVVGGGVIGTSVAYHLRAHDGSVTLLEKNALGSGTTAASMGRFNWDAADPLGIFLQREAWRTYEPLVEDGTIGFERCGYLRVAGTPAELDEIRTAATVLGAYGLDFEVLDAEETAVHGLDPGAVAGGLYRVASGYLNQQDVVEHFADGAERGGVSIETGVEVTGILTEGGAATGVETTDGTYDADVVVNAAGPWAPELNGMVGVALPLRHTTGPILVLDANEPLSIPFLKNVGGPYYFRPEGESKALAGRRWGRYDEASRLDPDGAHAVGDGIRRDVAALARSHVPGLADAEVINEWVGLRTVTPDFGPVVGPTRVDGFVVACGMSGAGVALAPVVGRAIADYVGTGATTDRLRILSADRFGRGTAPT